MRAGRGIGKKHLHITRAHILGIGLIGAAHVAGDPPHDLKLVGIVEASRGQPVAIVEQQGDFGKVPRRACRRPGKNHVFHATAPHRGWPVFPHNPAQRFKQVRLATAIRPDNPGQPIGNDQVGRIDKALEAGQP